MSEPRYLYKFRNFTDINHIRILTDNEIFFASASKFNDPFDCRIPINYHDGSRSQIVEYWQNCLTRDFTNFTAEQPRSLAEDLFDSGRLQSQEMVENAKKISEEFALNRMGIFSLSPAIGGILLWSHYAASHTGFAVGFSMQAVSKLTHDFNVGMKLKQIMLLQPIKYSHQYPILSAYTNSHQERMKGQFLRKAEKWNYENEYRILLQNGSDTIVEIPDDFISRIILGCQITEVNRQQMINILESRRHKPVLFQARKAEKAFALRFERIKYE